MVQTPFLYETCGCVDTCLFFELSSRPSKGLAMASPAKARREIAERRIARPGVRKVEGGERSGEKEVMVDGDLGN